MARELAYYIVLAIAAVAISLVAALSIVPSALAAPRVSLLDSDGEAAEHRAITIGSDAKAYCGELRGADGDARSWRWTAEPQGLVSISGASSREASISGVAEGSATVTVTATLPDGTELSDSMLLTSYTWLPKAYPASVSAAGGADLSRGATGDPSRDYVRCTAPAGQELEVVGTCGEGFFRVRLPEGFEFGDPDGHASNRNAFCRRASLEVPVSGVSLDRGGPLRLYVGDELKLSAAVDPPFASDRAVSWSSDDAAVAYARGGRVAARKAGKAVVTASCGGTSASVAVEVSPLVTVTEPYVLKRGRTWVSLTWEPCTRASAYVVQAYLEGSWAKVGSTSKTGYKVKGLKPGRKYSLRVVPYGAFGAIGKAASPKNKCKARTKARALAVGKAPAKKGTGKKKASKKKAGRASAISKTQRRIMETGTYSFPNWSGKVKLTKKDLGKLYRILSHGNGIGENGKNLKGKALLARLGGFYSDGHCDGMASSCFLDILGSLDVRGYVRQGHAANLRKLKKTKRVKSLIAYYQLLQYREGFSDKYVDVKLKSKGRYKLLRKSTRLKRFVENAWNGKGQVLHVILDPYRYGAGHAVVVLPFVKDKLAKSGYYELRAYDPDSPGRMLKIRVHATGELSIPAYFGGLRDNPIYRIQYAATERPWAKLRIDGS